MRLYEKYLVTEASLDFDQWEKWIKRAAKKMKEDYGMDAVSSGFNLGFASNGRYKISYFQNAGQMRSSGSASVSFDFKPDAKYSDIEKGMKALMKNPKIVKAKKEFSAMAKGQADYYKKRPMKNWPGI